MSQITMTDFGIPISIADFGLLPIHMPPEKVEIARSYSFKLNAGNYESRDFFCSQKGECRIEDAEKKSQQLYDFCRSQVAKAVAEYKKEHPKGG